VADVGGALRPDEAGEVKFLLARGGPLVLRTSFVGYEDSRTPIEIKLHQSQTIVLCLKPRG
jgi:hypothetical protein